MENVAAPACRQAGFTNRQKCSSRACSAKEVSRRLTASLNPPYSPFCKGGKQEGFKISNNCFLKTFFLIQQELFRRHF